MMDSPVVELPLLRFSIRVTVAATVRKILGASDPGTVAPPAGHGLFGLPTRFGRPYPLKEPPFLECRSRDGPKENPSRARKIFS